MQGELNRLVKRLYQVSDHAKKESRASLREGAKVLVKAAKEKAPVSEKVHYLYSNGRAVATYYPRNLRNSIRTLTFRSSGAVFVGPILGKGKRGVFKGNRTDGYYANWVEFGTVENVPQPFMRPTASQYGKTAIEIANKSLSKKVQRFARRYAVIRGRE